jgi:hypothetical protein
LTFVAPNGTLFSHAQFWGADFNIKKNDKGIYQQNSKYVWHCINALDFHILISPKNEILDNVRESREYYTNVIPVHTFLDNYTEELINGVLESMQKT